MIAVWCGYHFEVHPHEANWPEAPGLYVFARLQIGQWAALYVGQTGSLRKRIPTHQRWPGAKRFGATHIHARVEWIERERLAIEADLIQGLQPPMNVLGL